MLGKHSYRRGRAVLARLQVLQSLVHPTDEHLEFGQVAGKGVHLVAERLEPSPDLLSLTAAFCEEANEGGGQESDERPGVCVVHHSRIVDAARAREYGACNYGCVSTARPDGRR